MSARRRSGHGQVGNGTGIGGTRYDNGALAATGGAREPGAGGGDGR